MQETLKEQLYYFGYVNVDQNPTGYFKFDSHSAEDLQNHYKYRIDSATNLDNLFDPNIARGELRHNVDENFPLLDEEDFCELLVPA